MVKDVALYLLENGGFPPEVNELLKKQRDKGLAKYGVALDPTMPGYDWIDQAQEENTDALNYITAALMTDFDNAAYYNRALQSVADTMSILFFVKREKRKSTIFL